MHFFAVECRIEKDALQTWSFDSLQQSGHMWLEIFIFGFCNQEEKDLF